MKTIESQFDYISDLCAGYWKSQTLIVAIEFEIFTKLYKSGKSAILLARQIKSDKRATEMLLNALTGLGFLSKKGDMFKNRQISDRFLVKGRPMYQGNRILLSGNLWDNWGKLNRSVKTGGPVAFDNVCDEVDPERRRVFISAMRDFSVLKSKEVAKSVDLSDCKLLLDLGGGPGSFAIEFVKANSGLNAVVFDLEGVTEITNAYINEAKLEKRISTINGECLTDSYGKGLYDVVFVSNLLHMYDEKINLKIVKKCLAALRCAGRIIVHDFLLDNSLTTPGFASLFSLNMLTATHGGRNYSANEITKWLRQVGFGNLQQINLSSDSGLVIGTRNG